MNINAKDIIKRLRADGWTQIKSNSGSHLHFIHPVKSGKVTVIATAKSFAPKTIKSMFLQAGWDWPPR